MAIAKEQYQLPLTATKCSPRIRTTADPAPRTGSVPSAGAESEPSYAMAPAFVALTDLPNLRAAGITYPSTVHGWRWLFRRRHERGLDDAFRRVGRRILVDPQRYRELIRAGAGK